MVESPLSSLGRMEPMASPIAALACCKSDPTFHQEMAKYKLLRSRYHFPSADMQSITQSSQPQSLVSVWY